MKPILYEGQKHNMYEITCYLGLPKNYLYRLRGNVKAIKCMNIDYLEQIASLEGLKPEELRKKLLEQAEKEN